MTYPFVCSKPATTSTSAGFGPSRRSRLARVETRASMLRRRREILEAIYSSRSSDAALPSVIDRNVLWRSYHVRHQQ